MLSFNCLHSGFSLFVLFLNTTKVLLQLKLIHPFCLFRALRIYKVLSYYEGYWLLMKHYGEDSEIRMSNYLTKEENAMLSKSKQWRENSLIAFMIFNLIIPLLLLCFISFLSPYVYTIIPVYDTETCWQYFTQ